MAKLIILYKRNQWHELASQQVVGVFTNKNNAIDSLKNFVKKYTDIEPLDPIDLDDLHRINQTQSRNENFALEEIESNTIIL